MNGITPYTLAIHEAGHVIAAWAFGRPVTQIVLGIENPLEAIPPHDHRWNWGYICTIGPEMMNEAQIVEAMIFLAAGNVAQGIFDPESPRSEDDEHRLTTLAVTLCGQDAHGGVIGEAELRAERMAEQIIERSWAKVEKLADLMIVQACRTREIAAETINMADLIEAARENGRPHGIETHLIPEPTT